MNEPVKNKFDYKPIYQGTATNTLTKIQSTKQNTSIDGITHSVTVKRDKVTIKLNNMELLPGVKQETYVLLDVLAYKLASSGIKKAPYTVTLTLSEYMEFRGRKDRKETKKQVIKSLDVLWDMSISFTGNGKRENGFYDLRIIESKGVSRNGLITVKFGTDFATMLTRYPIMDYPTQLWTFNSNKNPNSYYLMRKVAELKRTNLGKQREDIVSVNTLLKSCPLIPTYKEVMQNGKHVQQQIIEPFERDMDACSHTFEWEYCHSKGAPLTEDEYSELENGMDYHTFINLKIKINWKNYPDQTKRIKKRKTAIQNAKRRKAKKEKTQKKYKAENQ